MQFINGPGPRWLSQKDFVYLLLPGSVEDCICNKWPEGLEQRAAVSNGVMLPERFSQLLQLLGIPCQASSACHAPGVAGSNSFSHG